MKKCISLFLVISMIMCNLNTGVVEALSSYNNEVKSLVNTLTNTEEEKKFDIKDDKVLEKKVEQVPTNNDEGNTNVVDSKTKNEEVEKYSDKKLSTYADEGNVKQNVILFYDLESDEFYYYIDADNIQKLSLIKGKITKNKINLNNVLTNDNLVKADYIVNPQEVTFVITGTGSYRSLYFDNDAYYDIPFNIVFYKVEGEHCDFSFENVKSMRVIGENTIKNSPEDYTALTYSFNDEDPNPLKMDDGSSFIVYNRDKENINNNIFYSEYDSGEAGDDSGELGDVSKNSGYSSIVNISFENSVPEGKKFILESVNNGTTSKKIPIKDGYDVLSMLLVSDKNSYLLKEEGNNNIPYYYRVSNSTDENNENNEISGQIRTKITLDKNSTTDCYEVNNKVGVEFIATKNGKSNYYLVDTLEKAINNYVNIDGDNFEYIFLGDYKIRQEDLEAIKTYNKDINSITFKTKVDDWKYLLKIDKDIELSINDDNAFSVTFDNIKFKYESNDKCIYANGRQLIFGSDVEMDQGYYPSVLLGGKNTSSPNFNSKKNTSLIIKSGTYDFVIGDCYNTLQNVDITIERGIFRNKVIGVSNNSQNKQAMNNVQLTIKGGTFNDKVIAVDEATVNNVKLTISNGTFTKNQVIGINGGIANIAELIISNGTFRNQVIGVNGGTVKSSILTINNGTFYDDIIGVSSNATTEKVTLNGLLNRYLFSNNMRNTNNQVQRYSSEATGVNINIVIAGGRFNNLTLIGNIGNPKDNSTINIEGTITIPTISEFTKLVVGEKRKGTLNVDKLDKGSSEGNLCLKKASKISFRTGKETTKLNNIELDGNNNTLVLPSNITSNITEEKVLIDLSGEVKTNGNNKLKIEFARSNNNVKSGMYLIKFANKSYEDIENKYTIPNGYYIRDEKEDDSSGYVVLYPQTTFDLQYNFENDTLYMINNGKKSEAWWYTDRNSNVSLDTNKLYKYKGYDLFKKNNENRNIILTGNGSNKTFAINGDLSNLNVTLDAINLTDSKITLNNLKSLIINGENTINSINENQDVFTYNFNSVKTGDKVSFKDSNSYLKIFTGKDTNAFNSYQGYCMDFKFLDSFTSDTIVRLKDNKQHQLKFNIPANTQRLGILINSNAAYNLYYGESVDTGTSVYVSGNTEETFKDSFMTLSNDEKAYEYVRRANPVNKIEVEIPNRMNFSINTLYTELNEITPQNWEEYFVATDMTVKNNSIVVEDQFINNGKTQNFGKQNIDLEFGYLGVTPSRSYNDIKLISKDKLDPDITNCESGVKLALKFLSKSGEEIPIDEEHKIITTPLNTWTVPSGSFERLEIVPDFDDNGHFFNVTTKKETTFDSSHKFTFRFGLKSS